MTWCLHLYFGLKAAFEFKGKAIVKDSDPLDQPQDHAFVIVRHQLLALVQKGFELVKPLLHGCAIGVLHQKVLLFFPECIDLIGQFVKSLLGIGFLQELLL